MSADSTELTFIRCSSCRSLVPAMSTRCRMCGADLQAKKAAPVPEPVAPSEKIEIKKPVMLATTELDPLNEFLSEDDQFDDVDIADDQLATLDQEIPEELHAESTSEYTEDFEDDFDEEQAIKELDSLLEELNATSASSYVAPVEPVIVPEVKPIEAKPMAVPKPEIKVEPVVVAPKVVIPKVVTPVNEQNLINKSQPIVPSKVEIKEEKVMEKEVRAVENKVTSIKSASLKQTEKQTALFGWFVSYQEAEGVSREIREGKFFVTAKSLKPNDLIIEDESVSTPHAMITVSHELGFQIQDLMSEHGLYIKKHGTKKYEVIDDIEVVENGDWIRFGNVEFMVVIMPV